MYTLACSSTDDFWIQNYARFRSLSPILSHFFSSSASTPVPLWTFGYDNHCIRLLAQSPTFNTLSSVKCLQLLVYQSHSCVCRVRQQPPCPLWLCQAALGLRFHSNFVQPIIVNRSCIDKLWLLFSERPLWMDCRLLLITSFGPFHWVNFFLFFVVLSRNPSAADLEFIGFKNESHFSLRLSYPRDVDLFLTSFSLSPSFFKSQLQAGKKRFSQKCNSTID